MWQILHASFWKFSKFSNSGISLNWSIIDEVKTHIATAYFFGPLCSCSEQLKLLFCIEYKCVLIFSYGKMAFFTFFKICASNVQNSKFSESFPFGSGKKVHPQVLVFDVSDAESPLVLLVISATVGCR